MIRPFRETPSEQARRLVAEIKGVVVARGDRDDAIKVTELQECIALMAARITRYERLEHYIRQQP